MCHGSKFSFMYSLFDKPHNDKLDTDAIKKQRQKLCFQDPWITKNVNSYDLFRKYIWSRFIKNHQKRF